VSSGLYEAGIKSLAASSSSPKSLPDPDRRVSVDNPFCGDRVDLEIDIEEGRVTALAQEVRGCMLCQAAANLVAQSAPGLSASEVEAVSASLTAMLKGDGNPDWPPEGWESLTLFEAVSRHKSRHGCVTLPFSALLRALG
jgi:NifU-like protein involved in Fe-S cluster formation